MCGITCVLGINCYNIIKDSLKQLQNRGYDSAGISTLKNNKFLVSKYASKNNLSAIDLIDFTKHEGSINGIAHTRWATHGEKNDTNSHPHISMCGGVSLVHNGIIENYNSIKNNLIQEGYCFKSETDSEVIVNLISFYLSKNLSNKESLNKIIDNLSGTYAIAVQFKNEPLKIYCLRLGSPLLIAKNNKFAMIVSEQSGFCNFFDNYITIENYDIGEIYVNNNIITITTNKNYTKRNIIENNIKLTPKPYLHWTIKEINEQVESSYRAFNCGGRILSDTMVKLGGLENFKNILIGIQNLILLGCGTSYYAACIGRNYFKKISNFNSVQVFDGAEFDEHDIPKNNKTAFLLLSQSGETKDLHRCISIAKKNHIFMIGIVNVQDSLIAREVNCGCYINAGREVAVASTKSFTSQIIVLVLIAIWFNQINKYNVEIRKSIISDLRSLHLDIKKCINISNNCVDKYIDMFVNQNSCFILGKSNSKYIAMEAALKIKEITYLHAEGYSSSSLKHGPFALLDINFPVVLIAPYNEYYYKSLNAYEEIKSRKAKILFISNKNCEIENSIIVPYNKSFADLLCIIPLQILAYKLAIKKNINPDIPKNLAKVVTVE